MFFIVLLIVFSVQLNQFKNLFLSKKSVRKIDERPEELLYKKLLFLYMCVIGSIVMFWNDVTFFKVPISTLVMGLHSIYSVSLLFIQPYKQSLRIHAVALYLNQLVYFVFLAVINLINLVDHID